MKRSDNIGWAQVKAGVLIVFALLLFAGGVVMMGDKTKFFVPKGALSVIMTDVAGLKVGAPVWLAGLDVGVVKDIRFSKPNQSNEVEILLEIEHQSLRKVGQDSMITIKTRGLMGEKYVDITPSKTVNEPPLTVVFGTSVTRLDDVMAKAGAAFDKLNGLMGRVDKGEGSLGRFAKDPKLYDHLVNLTAELKLFAHSVNSGQGTLGKLSKSSEPYDRLIAILERADDTLEDIQSADGTLGRLVRDRQLYDKLVVLADKSNQAAEDVRELNRKLTSTDGTIGKLLGDREFYDKGMELLERADNSLQSLQTVTAKLEKGEGTAGRLVSDKELYDRMNRVVDNLDALVKDIKENPKRYVKFSLF
ncbi:mce related protein [Geobacter sp. OR-1]|uniref:MlaD family protein n=1 Tax=Geobacter sp. OR-1 TaxID=1266765 RepID=UPI0005439337|nr:MlaD family protein [Geobacter sp. OR-1]GAM09036.1 mce related protein [Geobacter sp. OR-1]